MLIISCMSMMSLKVQHWIKWEYWSTPLMRKEPSSSTDFMSLKITLEGNSTFRRATSSILKVSLRKISHWNVLKLKLENILFGLVRGRSRRTSEGSPTPYYNSLVLADLTISDNKLFIKETLKDRFAVQQAVVLLQIWLERRHLNKVLNCLYCSVVINSVFFTYSEKYF